METGRHHDNVSTSLRGNLQLSWCLPVSVGTSSYHSVYQSSWEPPVIVVSTSLRGNLQLSWCLPVSVGTSSYRGVCQSPWEPPVIMVSVSQLEVPTETGRHHDNWRFQRRLTDTTITGGFHGNW
jgi:hypothetical protein